MSKIRFMEYDGYYHQWFELEDTSFLDGDDKALMTTKSIDSFINKYVELENKYYELSVQVREKDEQINKLGNGFFELLGISPHKEIMTDHSKFIVTLKCGECQESYQEGFKHKCVGVGE